MRYVCLLIKKWILNWWVRIWNRIGWILMCKRINTFGFQKLKKYKKILYISFLHTYWCIFKILFFLRVDLWKAFAILTERSKENISLWESNHQLSHWKSHAVSTVLNISYKDQNGHYFFICKGNGKHLYIITVNHFIIKF